MIKELTPLEALEIIKSIELSHMESWEDENLEGEMEWGEYEKYDGTVEECFPDSVKAITKALKKGEKDNQVLKFLKKILESKLVYYDGNKIPYVLVKCGNYTATYELKTEEDFKMIRGWIDND